MSFMNMFSRGATGSDPERGVRLEDAYNKPIELHSNLDRFRLMVGISTAPSMMYFPKDPPPSFWSKRDKKDTGITVTETPLNQTSDRGSTTSGGAPDEATVAKNKFDVIEMPTRPANNRGIYQTVVEKGIRCGRTYKYASLTINLCLGLQIVVAAALTALGASDSTKSGGVTVLGSINTVIAGLLTYLKGSGLPGKLKYFQHEWDKIRDYIEARERDLRCNDNAFDVHDQVDYVRFMFEAVKKDIDSNRSDRFTSSGSLHTTPETSELQTLQSKKLVSLSKAMAQTIKDAVDEKGKQGEKNLNEAKDKHVQDAVNILAGKAEELKRALHEEGDITKTLEGLLKSMHEQGTKKDDGKGKESGKEESGEGTS